MPEEMFAYFLKIYYDPRFQDPSLNSATVAPSSGAGTAFMLILLVAEWYKCGVSSVAVVFIPSCMKINQLFLKSLTRHIQLK
jgi:hypothetical protein